MSIIKDKYNVELPTDLVSFMSSEDYDAKLETLINRKFYIYDTEQTISINRLYRTEEEIIAENADYEFEGATIAIGNCNEGGEIVLVYDADGSKLYYWDIDMTLPLSSEEANVYYLADSFTELISEAEEGEELMKNVDYLPLGSIILTEGGIQKILVIARGIIVDNNGQELFFDYGGVPYPMGLMGNDMLYFNHENIREVVFEGFADEDDKIIVENINNYINTKEDLVYGNKANWIE